MGQYLKVWVVVGLSASPVAEAGTNDVKPVDSILDRLEKRLLDQEADGMTFGEQGMSFLTESEGNVTKYKYSKGKIEAGTSEKEKLSAINKLVTELESQVDQLASTVQKTKQSILDEAAIDNYVSLEAQLLDTDTASIKTLTIKIDGYSVYELSEAAGLWMPSKSVPLYAGPLQPGTHRLDLEARIVVRHKQALPMNGDVYRFVNKTFDLMVPGGVGNTRYVIAITPPQKLEDMADATIKQAL